MPNAVHILDSTQLNDSNLDIYERFSECKFVVSVSKRLFCVAIDQAHEQTNRTTKNFGGALSGELNELWDLARPEIMRVTKEFEDIAPARCATFERDFC